MSSTEIVKVSPERVIIDAQPFDVTIQRSGDGQPYRLEVRRPLDPIVKAASRVGWTVSKPVQYGIVGVATAAMTLFMWTVFSLPWWINVAFGVVAAVLLSLLSRPMTNVRENILSAVQGQKTLVIDNQPVAVVADRFGAQKALELVEVIDRFDNAILTKVLTDDATADRALEILYTASATSNILTTKTAKEGLVALSRRVNKLRKERIEAAEAAAITEERNRRAELQYSISERLALDDVQPDFSDDIRALAQLD